MGRQETGIAVHYGYGTRIVGRQETGIAFHYGYGATTAPHVSVGYILARRFGSLYMIIVSLCYLYRSLNLFLVLRFELFEVMLPAVGTLVKYSVSFESCMLANISNLLAVGITCIRLLCLIRSCYCLDR